MSKIVGNFCKYPGCENENKRYCRRHLNYTVPVVTEIANVSDKRKKLDREYSKKKKQYLTANPFCEAKIEGCTKVATDIHHQAGKATEEDYLNADLFLSVCRHCHEILERNPAWAKQNGFSISRHAKRTA